MLLKLSSFTLAGREFQIVGVAWQNARLPKTVLAPCIVKQTMVTGAETQ